MSLRSSVPRSAAAGIAGPAIHSSTAARLLLLQQQLGHSQWWPRERIEAHRFRPLSWLLDHAVATVPHYRAEIPRETGSKFFVFRSELPA